tara:strand:+ start:34767 stop:35378 length:612 start_codon:yes stop_codon:yes gene_type:complete
MLDPNTVTDSLVPLFRPILDPQKSDYRLRVVPNNLDRCNEPFSTIQVIDIEEQGMAEYGDVVEGLGLQIKQDVFITIRIQSFGEGSGTRTRRLSQRLEFPTTTDSMKKSGFGLIRKTTVQDITGINTTGYESRHTFDMVLSATCGEFINRVDTEPEDFGKAGFPVYDENVDFVEQAPICQILIPDGAEDGDEIVFNYTISNNQ